MPNSVQAVLDRLLTTRQVAEKFGVTVKDVQYQIKRGRIKAYRFGNYFYVVDQRDLPDKWPSHI